MCSYFIHCIYHHVLCRQGENAILKDPGVQNCNLWCNNLNLWCMVVHNECLILISTLSLGTSHNSKYSAAQPQFEI